MDDDLPGMMCIAIGDCGTPDNRPPGWPYPSFDAMHWVEEFAKQHPEIDQGEMLGWFCNSLMAGYDHAQRSAAPTPDIAAKDAEIAALRLAQPYIEVIAEWERKNGTLAGIMDGEYATFCVAMARAAIHSNARAALDRNHG